jgi:hypothetical protein
VHYLEGVYGQDPIRLFEIKDYYSMVAINSKLNWKKKWTKASAERFTAFTAAGTIFP